MASRIHFTLFDLLRTTTDLIHQAQPFSTCSGYGITFLPDFLTAMLPLLRGIYQLHTCPVDRSIIAVCGIVRQTVIFNWW